MKKVVYPVNDINLVGRTLETALHRKLQEGCRSIIRVSEKMHYYPPTIYLINAQQSPFSKDNALTNMPTESKSDRDISTSEGPSDPKRIKTTNDTTSDETFNAVHYQCDMCDFSDAELETLKSHIKSNRHQSFSSYRHLVSSDDSTESVVGLDKPIFYQLITGQNDRQFGSLAPFCPNCFLPFPDKFSAAYHRQVHHECEAKFALAPVVLDEQINLSMVPKCLPCNLEFDRAQKLHKHWNRTDWSCSPFPELPNMPGPYIILLQCTECTTRITRYLNTEQNSLTLRNLFITFRNHIGQSHSVGEAIVHLIYIHLPPGQCPSQSLAPMIRKNPDELITSLLTQSRSLKKYLKSFLGLSKIYVTKVSNEEAILKKFLT